MKPLLKSPQSLIVAAVLLLPVLPTSVATSALACQLGSAEALTLMPVLALVALVSITACCWLGNRLLSLSLSTMQSGSQVATNRPDAMTSAVTDTAARAQSQAAGKPYNR